MDPAELVHIEQVLRSRRTHLATDQVFELWFTAAPPTMMMRRPRSWALVRKAFTSASNRMRALPDDEVAFRLAPLVLLGRVQLDAAQVAPEALPRRQRQELPLPAGVALLLRSEPDQGLGHAPKARTAGGARLAALHGILLALHSRVTRRSAPCPRSRARTSTRWPDQAYIYSPEHQRPLGPSDAPDPLLHLDMSGIR